MPADNCAQSFGYTTYVDLVARATFGEGISRDMQTDSRVTWTITPPSCGSMSNVGGYKRVTIAADCRTTSISVNATITIGGTLQSGSKSLTVKWLNSIDLNLYYRDAATIFASTEVKWRYTPSASCLPQWHLLRARTWGTLNSGEGMWLSCITYAVSTAEPIAKLSGTGSTRTLAISAAGTISISVAPTPDQDGLSDSRSLTARFAADDYTFLWDLALTCNTLSVPYMSSSHRTYPRLIYTGGYVETLDDAERTSLIKFISLEPNTIAVTGIGVLQPQVNGMARLSAQFCDDAPTLPETILSNLRYSSPFDYDLGGACGQQISHDTGASQVCIPIKLYSQYTVSKFQFLLRFSNSLLRCGASSCGTFTPGAAWNNFGSSVSFAPNAGQVQFLSNADVSSKGQQGLLDIGTQCFDVASSGLVTLDVEFLEHRDVNGVRSCGSGSHLKEVSVSTPTGLVTRCYSRTASTTFTVVNNRRQLGWRGQIEANTRTDIAGPGTGHRLRLRHLQSGTEAAQVTRAYGIESS